jgi:hypothetical protein
MTTKETVLSDALPVSISISKDGFSARIQNVSYLSFQLGGMLLPSETLFQQIPLD